MGSIRLTPDITEIDYVPVEVRVRAGDIILVCALIQQQLSQLFSHLIDVNPAVFTYLGHDLDTSKTINAIKRLAKSDDCPIDVSDTLISALNKCADVLQKRNKIAHGPLMSDSGLIFRYEIEGGKKPQRIANVLSIEYFDKALIDAKAALWGLRQQVMEMDKRETRSG